MNYGKPHRKSEHPWIENANFSALTQAEVLNQVIENTKQFVENAAKTGRLPALVYDLDSTLFEVEPRTLRIAKEFARSPVGRQFPGPLRQWWLDLMPQDLHYRLEETAEFGGFHALGAETHRYLEQLRSFWKARFFSDAYLLHDLPAPGARNFVRRTEDLGANIIYLTGRDAPNMERGTRAALHHWGFPVHHRRTQLGMKPRFGMDDSDFKGGFLAELKSRADVIALFDNEPANFSAFEKNFPQAALVFRHSTCSAKPAKTVSQVFRIDNFHLHG